MNSNNAKNIKEIKEIVEEFFQKMTIEARVDIGADTIELEDILKDRSEELNKVANEITIKTSDPQVLIGEKGQTLNEIQRILRAIASKKLSRPVYINIDINDYKKKKTDYLKNLATGLADEAVLKKEARVFPIMSSYERRIIHTELSGRKDIKTESEGEEPNRRVIVRPV